MAVRLNVHTPTRAEERREQAREESRESRVPAETRH